MSSGVSLLAILAVFSYTVPIIRAARAEAGLWVKLLIFTYVLANQIGNQTYNGTSLYSECFLVFRRNCTSTL